MPNYRSLQVTTHALDIVEDVYDATRCFPSDERYGLSSQMRRAAVSIGANIAEGAGRGGDREFARFLRIARGSVHELEFEVLTGLKLGILSKGIAEKLQATLEEQSRMLSGLIRKLSSNS
ncbi:MAG TPA: four helix bundle protein [Gemmatimonadales bacterium]|jgi:four helix bundle protein|nr:four helix bundle protein [Gemmatimonadales bacterium]